MAIDLDTNAGKNPNPGQADPGQQGKPGAGQPPAGTTQPAASQVQGDIQTLEGGAKLEKASDGTLRLTVTPDDPHSAVYTGKDINEVLANLAKGKSEADRKVSELYSQIDGAGDDDDDVDIAVPDEQKLRLDLAGRNGIDPKFLSFTEEQWNEYERDHSAAGTWNLMQKTEAIKQAAHQQVAQAQDAVELVSINENVIDEETVEVNELLKEYNVDPKEFAPTYTKIIGQVVENDKNYKGGVLRPGVITRMVSVAMREHVTKSDRERLEREIAEKNRQLKDAGAGGGSGAGFSQGTQKHKSSEDAASYILTHLGEFQKG